MTLTQKLAYLNLQADYQKTLALLRALKLGEVDLDAVAMTPDGWGLVQVTDGDVGLEAKEGEAK